MRKSVYIYGLSSLLLAACTRSDDAIEQATRGILFQPVVYSTHTQVRAGNDYPQGVSFGTYAWMGLDDKQINLEPYIPNTEVTYQAPHWAPVTPAYWPLSGFLDFFCYSPYAASNPQPAVEVHTDYWLNTLTYTDVVASVTGTTPDYMYTEKSINQSYETTGKGGGVSAIFNHALAKVKVGVRLSTVDDGKGKTWQVKLKTFTINNITNKGGVVLKLSSDKSKWTKPSPAAVWKESTEITDKETWDVLLGKTDAEKQLTTTSLVTLKEALVIPQALEEAMKLTIAYDIITTKGGTSNTEQKELTVVLNTIKSGGNPILNWEMNKVISYNVVINPPSSRKPLTFDPSIGEWTGNEPDIEVRPN